MKKYRLPLLIIIFTLSLNSLNAQKKGTKVPYTVEFGTITSSFGDNKIITYFEEYGNKFRDEFYNKNGELYQITAHDGDSLRSVSKGEAVINMGVIKNPYFNSGSEEAIKSKDKKFTKLENIIVAGKNCQQFKYFNDIINQYITIASWNGVIMSNNSTRMVVKSIDTNNKPQKITYKITTINE